MTEIEKLDVLGRQKGIVIYAIHQCNSGWGTQWAEGNGPDWRERLAVYGYYPTVTEMVAAEIERLKSLASPAS